MIQRYYVSRPNVNTEEDEIGGWVKYDDVLILLEQKNQLELEVELYKGILKLEDMIKSQEKEIRCPYLLKVMADACINYDNVKITDHTHELLSEYGDKP